MAHGPEKGDFVHGIIRNIPENYHSSDLRNFFSQFVESGGFECFHFRHRPELINPEYRPVTGGGQQVSKSKTKSKTGSTTTCEKDHDDDASDNGANICKKTCCIVKLRKSKLVELISMYHRKHWQDRRGDSISALCFISKIRVSKKEQDTLQSRYKTRAEQKKVPAEREEFTEDDLDKLPELHPPVLMRNGNVGTPTRVFLDLIRNCKLPPAVIKKLGLQFPQSRRKRRYGNVPFDYGGEKVKGDLEEIPVISGKGHEIEPENKNALLIQSADSEEEKEKIKQTERLEGKEENNSDSEQDDDGCEEWERHEALTDDATNKERNKERVFEEEMEVVWEKGGSGLVFYTDAQFWREKDDGDFDEQTADDWDVDMSVYYDPQGGDMDSRDFVKIRQEQRRRKGEEDTDRYTTGIGQFERHTKGIGRRVMTQQGWKDGESLGSSVVGIAEALDNEGQAGRDKRGLGYHGEKLQRFGSAAKCPRADEGLGRITSVYDKPKDTDPTESLHRRNEPYGLKSRAVGGISFRKPSTFTSAAAAPACDVPHLKDGVRL